MLRAKKKWKLTLFVNQNFSCDPVDGRCTCPPGWEGPLCRCFRIWMDALDFILEGSFYIVHSWWVRKTFLAFSANERAAGVTCTAPNAHLSANATLTTPICEFRTSEEHPNNTDMWVSYIWRTPTLYCYPWLFKPVMCGLCLQFLVNQALLSQIPLSPIAILYVFLGDWC